MTVNASERPWQLLAVDVDSTLIGRDHKVDAVDAHALVRAADAGIRVALCTGRNVTETAGVIGALDLRGPGVFANGATLADMAAGVHTWCRYVPAGLTRRVVDFFGDRGHAVLALADHPDTRKPHYLITDHGPPHQATVEWLLANRMRAENADVTCGPMSDRVVRLSIVVNVPDAAAIEHALTRDFGAGLMHHSIYSKYYDCQVIETFLAGVNKWSGIVDLCRASGLDPARVVTIGDDVNDVAMLENATLSFAVANAPPAIRACAKRVTAAQGHGGVARVVDYLLDNAAPQSAI